MSDNSDIITDFSKCYFSSTHDTPIGKATIATDGFNLVGLWLEGQKHFGGPILDQLVERDDFKIFDKVKHWLDRYFEGKKPAISEIPLQPIGASLFRYEVWEVVKQIPWGKVTTYNQIAKKLVTAERGDGGYRAVGVAVGNNPILIIVPCHRVLGKRSNSTALYAAGEERKLWLLNHEEADLSIRDYPIPPIKQTFR